MGKTSVIMKEHKITTLVGQIIFVIMLCGSAFAGAFSIWAYLVMDTSSGGMFVGMAGSGASLIGVMIGCFAFVVSGSMKTVRPVLYRSSLAIGVISIAVSVWASILWYLY